MATGAAQLVSVGKSFISEAMDEFDNLINGADGAHAAAVRRTVILEKKDHPICKNIALGLCKLREALAAEDSVETRSALAGALALVAAAWSGYVVFARQRTQWDVEPDVIARVDHLLTESIQLHDTPYAEYTMGSSGGMARDAMLTQFSITSGLQSLTRPGTSVCPPPKRSRAWR